MSDITLRTDGAQDWAEVLLDGVVVYRGHIDEAKDYVLVLLPVTWLEGENVAGKRVHIPPERLPLAPVLPQEALEAQVQYLEAKMGKLAQEMDTRVGAIERKVNMFTWSDG